jgi:hypothetical protein
MFGSFKTKMAVAALVGAGMAAPSLGGLLSADAVGGYKVAWTGSGLNVRSNATTASAAVARLADGTSLDLRCYVRGQLVNGRNDVWYQLNGPVPNGFVTASYVTTPSDPLPGLPACGAATPAPAPATATATIGNRVADLAITYQGRWGGDACIDAGLGSGGRVGGYSGGQCRQFVNCLVWRASGRRINPASPDYSFSGASRVSFADARRGDIIQYGIGGHTAIVLQNLGRNTFQVVDSNWSRNERVQVHNYTPPANATIWRYSQAATG